MKKKSFILVPFCLFLSFIALQSNSGGRASSGNTGSTGAPSEGTCGSCHNANVFGTVSLSITVFEQGTTTQISSYIPGATYDVRVSIQNTSGSPAGFGFQLTAMALNNNTPLSGYSGLASNVKQRTLTSGLFSGRTYVEHNGVTNNNQFNFRWTAPAAGAGSVRLYASGNAVNGNGSSTGDRSANSTLTLTEMVLITVSGNATNVSCNGGNNGAISISVTGGTAPFTFNWSDGSSQQNRADLRAGSYSVTVMDNSGTFASASFNVNEPTVLNVNITSGIINCHGESTSVNVTATGGTPPYSGTGTFNQSAGAQIFTVTDANGCSASVTINIPEPQPLGILTTSGVILCAGETTSVLVTANGGTPPYSGTGAFTVTAGNSTFTVTDSRGCTATTSISISAPTPLTAIATNDTINCQGGSVQIEVTATGGVPPYSGTGVFTKTTAGTFIFTVSDDNGCNSTATSTVFSSSGLSSSETISNNFCHHDCEGAIAVSVTGGALPYSFLWSNGSIQQNQSGLCAGEYSLTIMDADGCELKNNYLITKPHELAITIQIQEILCQGNDAIVNISATGGVFPYTGTGSFAVKSGIRNFEVSDGNGCSQLVELEITEPDELVVVIDSIAPSTNGANGEIKILVNGGIAPYNFQWSNGAETESINGLSPDVYAVTVTDSIGCVVTEENIEVPFIAGISMRENFSLKLYPNPAKDFLTLKFESLSGIQEISIFNIDGMKVWSEKSSGELMQRIDISQLPSSLYIIEINSEQKRYFSKFVKIP